MAEDMNSVDQATEHKLALFNEALAARRVLAGSKPDWYRIVRGAFWDIFKWDIFEVTTLSMADMLSSLFYTYFIVYLIQYLKDPLAEWQEGAILAAIFICTTIFGSFVRNTYFF